MDLKFLMRLFLTSQTIIETAEEWQNRPLKKFYTFLFVDCLHVSIRKEMETKSCAVYVIL